MAGQLHGLETPLRPWEAGQNKGDEVLLRGFPYGCAHAPTACYLAYINALEPNGAPTGWNTAAPAAFSSCTLEHARDIAAVITLH